MSGTTVELRRQISSATDLLSVVRTMKALAASSIAQYENSVEALAVYYRTVEQGLGACFRDIGPTPPALPHHGASGEDVVHAVVFGSDQGLVGRFNEAVADQAIATLTRLSARPRVWAVGERVHARLADAGLPPTGLYAVPTSIHGIVPLVGRILVDSQQNAHDGELRLFYNSPVTGATYESTDQRLLPLDDDWRRARVGLPWPARNLPEIIGGCLAALPALIGEYLFVSIFRACAESLASENASRLAAMERADKNINELLESLGSRFNRLRQSGIDEELFEVLSGFEALTRP